MAKKQPVMKVAETEDELDDLLGNDNELDDLLDDDTEVGTKPDQAGASPKAKAAAAKAVGQSEKSKEELKAEADELKQKLKDEKAKAKAAEKEEKDKKKAADKEKKDAEKAAKKLEADAKRGPLVKFTNQAGQEIQGRGQLYWVVRQGGKLHYKAHSSVEVLGDIDVEVPAPAAKQS